MVNVLFVKPPRTCWPYMNDRENIVIPQALPCLAAVLLKEGFTVKIIDCFPLKLGWKSLKKKIREEKPDIICISESEFLWGHEGIKAAKLAKEINPKTITIAGGLYFSTQEKIPKEIDFIVKREGEKTLIELTKELQKPKNKQKFHKIKGIMYKNKKNKTIITLPRPLIKNLDTLPFPAYHLMEMNYYTKDRLCWNLSLVTIHHSRGCDNCCSFCSCWLQMVKRTIKNGKEILIPKWRTKSVKRTIAEIEWLHKEYNCKKFEFTDDTWNLNPKWNEEFADTIQQKKLNIKWGAFMRLDCILRDEKLGVMQKLVNSGLIHIITGVERSRDEDFKKIGKPVYNQSLITDVLNLIRRKYPSVFVNTSFIFGFYDETSESMIRISEYAKQLDLDHFATFLLTPIKGTPLWEKAKKEGLIEVEDLRYYDWYTAIMPSKHMSRKELEDLCIRLSCFVDKFWLFNDIKKIFLPYKYRREKHLYFLKIRFRTLIDALREKIRLKSVLETIQNRKNKSSHGILPKWYYS